jgi:cell division protein FtsB
LKILIAVLILIFIGLQYRLWIGDGSFADINRLDQQVSVQESENAELEQRNDTLVREVEELQTGMDAIEEHARNELGLIKEGETFFLIIEEDQPSENTNISLDISYPE